MFRISHFATADEFTDTTIRVITIEKRQYGEYICKASNVLGTTEATVYLYGEYYIIILIDQSVANYFVILFETILKIRSCLYPINTIITLLKN